MAKSSSAAKTAPEKKASTAKTPAGKSEVVAKSTVTAKAPIAEQPTKPAPAAAASAVAEPPPAAQSAAAAPSSSSSAKSGESHQPLGKEELRKMNAYWRAANYLSVGQIYLCGNPMLREPLELHNIKSRLLGHWGTTPGQNFIYVHMNRAIKMRDLNMIYIAGPGHGGPGLVANAYLEGTYSEVYPNISETEEGLQKLMKQFSFPGGIPSHVSPECPGSIHEGGELGYSIAHAYGAAFDNPDLVVCCCVGDGESETGPAAGAWHSNKFLNPARDGAVLLILHLNGYKIANPTIPGRMSDEDLMRLYAGYGYKPYFVEGTDPEKVHQQMAATVDLVLDEIKATQDAARKSGNNSPGMPRWPMIIMRTLKGWTGPKVVDGKPVEGTWRAHQVPVTDFENPAHLKILEDWMKSYKAEELFDENGTLIPELKELAPKGNRRMGANPHANGGILLRDLVMPDFREYGIEVHQPGGADGEATRVLGTFLRDVMKANLASANFRVWGPDETASNRLDAIYEASPKVFMEKLLPTDEYISETGRVMEVLSEHMCQGWFEGYLLTGRHGLFSCYEAFVHIVDSMFNQHAKWLKVTRDIPWRRPISSLNYLLTSHVWRQDHNGFTHQDPGFIDHVVNKKADVVRVYLPPDANTLLSVADHCLRSRNYVNVIIAGKQPAPQYLDMNAAVEHCTVGIGMWPWACNDAGSEPDVVMACAGDVPTLETLAAIDLLRQHFSDIKIRFVNVVDLMTLQTPGEHPHGISDRDFDSLFTIDKPVIFAFHGYPSLIHRLTYKRTNHGGLHVHGYKEEGTITTPFDMPVLNELDRFHLAGDAVDRIPRLQKVSAHFQQHLRNKLFEHKQYIYAHGDDMPEIKNWKWPYAVTGD
jgi:xylulose-5-phosphate/fructose-6-phosphate phosphoketolase